MSLFTFILIICFVMAPEKTVDINIDVDFHLLTIYDVGEIVNHILKFLAHQRCQIPFVYNLFDRKVESFKERSDKELEQYTQLTKYNVQRQRDQAKQTKDALGAMGTLIKEMFDTNMVKTVRFLFGATMFTPKEVYTVHVPVELMHKTRRRVPLPAAIINELMLKLIMDENLGNLFSKPLSTTIIHMDMELAQRSHNDCTINFPPNMHRKTLVRLPQNCRNVNFHVVHKPTIQKIVIFQDPVQEEVEEEEDNCNYADENSGSIPVDENMLDWWESMVIVRGFKDNMNKKFNIW